MTHSLCESAEDGELSYLRRLWETLLAPDLDPASKLGVLFADETVEFDLSHAYLSRIDPEAGTQRFEVVHGPHGDLEAGNTIQLSTSYCRRTIDDPRGTMAVSDALAEGWADDPAYRNFGFGTYLGTTVSLDDELYGTLCYASVDRRRDPITEAEMALVELHALWITHELNRWSGPATHRTDADLPKGRSVSAAGIDSMMEALRKRERRVILSTLLDESTERDVGTLERVIDAENTPIRIHHTHLPKLERAGYVTWDPDSTTYSRGPKFPEVEPLLRLLHEFADEPPQ